MRRVLRAIIIIFLILFYVSVLRHSIHDLNKTYNNNRGITETFVDMGKKISSYTKSLSLFGMMKSTSKDTSNSHKKSSKRKKKLSFDDPNKDAKSRSKADMTRPKDYRYNVTLEYDEKLEIYQNPYFHLVSKPPPYIKTYYFKDIREFMEFYMFWQNDMYENNIITPINCFAPTTHGLANKLIGMFNVAIISMISGRLFEICDWPDFKGGFKFTFNVPFRRKYPAKYLVKFTNGCYDWPELKNMTLDDFTRYPYRAYKTNCHLLYTLYGIPSLTQRFYEMGIDLSFNNYKGNKDYVYHAFFDLFIQPNDNTKSVINLITRDWDSYCVYGFHIRVGDAAFRKDLKNTTWLWMVHRSTKKALEMNETCGDKPIKWFVISDSIQVKHWFDTNYPQYTLYYKSRIGHTGVSGLYTTRILRDAIAELYSFSRADYRILRYGTTYGYLASTITLENNIWVK